MRPRTRTGPPPESVTLELSADSELAAHLTSALMSNSVEGDIILGDLWVFQVVRSEIAWPPPRYANGGAVDHEDDKRMLRFRLERFTSESQAEAPARRPKTFCVQCGPNVAIDGDGCCATCGGGAVGPWVDRVRVLIGGEL